MKIDDGPQMLVFWKENLVLLAVPKTGSTALQGALAPRASGLVVANPGAIQISPTLAGTAKACQT